MAHIDLFFWQKIFFLYNCERYLFGIHLNLMKKNLFTKPLALFQSREQEISNGLFFSLKKNFFAIPISVRLISFSMFLFMLGWGLGADTFFSLYIETIVKNVLLVSVIGAILPLSKMFFSLPIWEIDDHSDMKQVLFLSKILYVISWLFFFGAWILHSPWILIAAVIFNGFASATMFSTYESYIHLVKTDSHDDRESRWLYFSSINGAYVVWALISYFLVQWINLEYLYLFIVLFSLVSLIADRKIPLLQFHKIKKFFWETDFLRYFFGEVFSFGPIKRTYAAMKYYPKSILYVFGFEAVFNILNYIWFIFIPLAAAANHLSLGEVALVFAIMKLPYLTNLFTASWSQRFHKKSFILTCFVFMSLFYAAFAFNTSFWGTMILSFAISMGLAIVRPLIYALFSENTHPDHAGSITGMQHFVGTFAEVIGILLFGALSSAIGVQHTFLIVGIGLFVLAGVWILRRYSERAVLVREKRHHTA